MNILSSQKRIWLLFSLFFCFSYLLKAQSFSVSSLQGENIVSPTSLQFGPDGRLYVSQQNGVIYAYTIQRNTSTNYQITATEPIMNVQQIQNHNDNGSVNNLDIRQVTGILVTGTANNVVLYVTSSDSRIGGGGGGSDLNLDTNSGVISRLTKSGNSWQRLDLVRGLPRSEENHASNGMQLQGNTLYVAQGGNTNAGSPSNNFAFASEYALSGAILSVNLAAIDAMSTKTASDGSQYKYDLPTVDDPTRANQNGQDINDPFGGNDGLNQAKLVPGGPVQIFASGFRNIYDLVFAEDGRLYTWDNGPNGGWGGHPANEGFGTATNNWIPGEPGSNGPGPNDAQVNNLDGLHFVSSSNYYGGHPNPIRANPNGAGLFTHDANLGSGGNVGVWRTSTNGQNPLPADWPPLPSNLANPIEGDYQNPGVNDPSIFTVNNSTNGLTEYTASNFNNAMKGDLLAASFKGPIYRVQRNNSGGINSSSSVTELANNFSALPLDITAQGDNDPFPGTIWVANLGSDNISVFEPQDFGSCGGGNTSADEDGDQYTNADELANGTDPCNAASLPADFDKTLINGFLVSNLNDPDDDDDGLNDSNDPFVWDAQNGTTTSIPIDYPLLNADPGFGFFGLGFTGLMSNGSTDYLNLIQDEDNSATEIIAGGAVGLLTFNNVPKGDPYTNNNTQQNGFQFGINVNQSTQPFVYEGRILGPVFSSTPQQYQSAGIFIGTGDQANYLKVVINGNGTITGVQILYEEANAIVSNQQLNINNIGFASEVSLFINVTPSSGQVQVQYGIGNGTPQNLGQPVQLQGNVLNALQSNQSLATGIISTAIGSTSTFNATWDYLKVNFLNNPPPPPPNNIGTWVSIDNGNSCNNFGQSGSCAQGRHEAAYVQVGNKFYLIGGRENNSNVNIYDPATDIWTIGANAPFPVHHVQALAYDGLIYMIGSFIDNNFPNENPNPNIVIYDPLANQWLTGPAIPNNRLRGSSGAVVYQDKIYIVNGLTNGHASGWVNWFDVFDPRTNQWTQLPNSPRTRDHFHAAVVDNKLYVTGGRRSGQITTFTPTVGEVDVYNFQTNSWSTLPNNIPTERAACTVGVLGNELIVMGGERNGGLANNQTEALNLSTNNWRTLAPMIEGRHGTQAIVNNNGIYVAAGSPNTGGGQTRSQEAFFLGNQTSPTGSPITASTLGTSTNSINFTSNNSSQNLTLTNTNGSQGILIQGLSTTNNAFSANLSQGLPLHLPPNGSVTLQVNFSSGNNASGQLNIQHTGNNAPNTSVNLSASSNPPPPPPTGNEVYINVGGPTVTTSGITWQADQYFNAGNPYNFAAAIGGTTDDVIYQTNRWNANDLQYNIPVSNGTYEVELHFAEIYFINGLGGSGAGKRVFDINLEGQQVVNDYDVNAITGSGSPFANVQSFTVAVNDGTLSILLQKQVENPMISAISVKPSDGNPPPPPPSGDEVFINVGGPAVTTGGNNWQADQYFNAGNPYNFAAAIGGTTDDIIYQTNRWNANDLLYTIPVSNGNYEVKLHFAEIYFINGLGGSGAGKRVFDINLEGQQVFNDYDVNAITGSGSPFANVQTFTVGVNDGTLNILLQKQIENPMLSAISFKPSGGTPPPPPPPNADGIYINAGGPAVNINGINWGADQYFSTSNFYNTSAAIANTTSDVIYQTERYNLGNLGYNVPVSNGTYEVQLHFAEIFYVGGNAGVGQRVFNINIEGQQVLSNYDINAVTGASAPTANIQTFTTTVSDGTLNIALNATQGQTPKISAIAIIPAASANRSIASRFEAFPIPGRKVRMHWGYGQNNRPNHYEVEYAKGEEDYQLLETIAAEKTTNFEVYGVQHEHPSVGANHYRIKVVFEGGAFHYIDPQIVNFESLKERLSVFPNPTKGQLFVDLENYKDQQVQLSIANINGIEIEQKQIAADHENIVELDISNFENGFYILRAKADGKRIVSQKVMVVRQY